MCPSPLQIPDPRTTTSEVNPPAFKFRLEDVRALRERAENRAKGELADSLATLRDGEDALRRAEQARQAARGTFREHATGGRSAGELQAAQAYLERAERSRLAADRDVSRREADVEARRESLMLAARERELLERLKSRRRAEHASKAVKAEAAALDELAVSRHRARVGAR
jgi:flagellar protein FliJ